MPRLGHPGAVRGCYAWRLDPPDFHAVFEAYLGGRWWLFDPTRQAALDGLVRIGVGRDASEVAFSTIHGAARPNGMTVRIEPVRGSGAVRPATPCSRSARRAAEPAEGKPRLDVPTWTAYQDKAFSTESCAMVEAAGKPVTRAARGCCHP